MQDHSTIQLPDSFSVGPCPLGEGIFARQRIRQATMILRFTGPIVSGEEARAKGSNSFNLLQIGPSEYIDLEHPGVFLNHSCTPNAGVVDDTVLIALRDIAPGEEITFDYSTTMSEQFETMECLCGQSNCRRVIGDFHDLPRQLKDRYLAARLVQSFIVSEHRERQRGDRPALERSTGLRATEPCDVASGVGLGERRCA
jgi:hypothetical protein